jgi:small subunit ribosomal protein S8
MNPLANMLIAIKNAGYAHKSETTLPYSMFKHSIARALHAAGYIASFEKKTREKGGDILAVGIAFREDGRTPRITDVHHISKPSRRVYKGADDLRTVRQGFGHIFVTTPKGIMTSSEAKKAHVGGELLFEIW